MTDPFDREVIAALMELPQSPPASPAKALKAGKLGQASPRRTPGSSRAHDSPFSSMAARVHRANPSAPRSPFFDGAFSPLTGFHEGDASRLGSLSALRRADRIDAEAGAAPLLRACRRRRRDGAARRARARRRRRARPSGGRRRGPATAPRRRASRPTAASALGRRSPGVAGYAESCGSADSSPGEPAPRRWISVKITPSSVELRRAIARASATKRFKPCNCRNSRCLKLYCDCFAAGRFCEESCKCVDCHNDQAHARDRDDAIKATLEKNPKAFRAKVNAKAKTHQNGCHCKKSKCLKKYCECFEAGITCGAKCKCADCENYPGSLQLAARRDKLRGDEADGPDDSTASAAFLDLLRSAATEASKDDDAAALPALKRPRADDDAALESPRDKVVLVTPVDGAPNPQQLFVEAA
ncbi:DNA-binding transcription factor [Aureococcus anophagefferens]|nr:DNA-binding transcription factor [Aureococcus anophagefferens]